MCTLGFDDFFVSPAESQRRSVPVFQAPMQPAGSKGTHWAITRWVSVPAGLHAGIHGHTAPAGSVNPLGCMPAGSMIRGARWPVSMATWHPLGCLPAGCAVAGGLRCACFWVAAPSGGRPKQSPCQGWGEPQRRRRTLSRVVPRTPRNKNQIKTHWVTGTQWPHSINGTKSTCEKF